MDDSLILQRLRLGDKNAFKDLFDKYFDPLLILALHYCKDMSDAKDIVQEIFISFWAKEQYAKINNDAALRAYLFRVLKNKCLDALEAQKRLRDKLEDYAQLQFDIKDDQADADAPHRTIDFSEALQKLPKKTYSVVKMVYFGNKRQKEAAVALGLSPNTVRNQLVRAMKYLRKNVVISKNE